jgi:aromatic-L-amino-acid decarboxylase
MTTDEFRKSAHNLVEWMAEYMDKVEEFPVKSLVKPREIFNRIPDEPPLNPESFNTLMKDFEEIILPGITHWQHPGFFAYFPSNTSPPSILAEMLIATLGAQCMMWETSPAAAELEEKMMNWLKDLIGLPECFEGVIQDSASTATLAAIISAREKKSGNRINNNGCRRAGILRVYCSDQTHSSVEKAVKICGIGSRNLVRVKVRDDFSMDPEEFYRAVKKDKRRGFLPCCAVVTLGTTGTTAVDPLKALGEICAANGIWLHVDSAFAGNALILPEFQWMLDGREYIDSLVFNPHKWLFTNFDCSAYFVREADSLIKAFEILPEYLKTRTRGMVNDYRDWGVPLGRRFRALKLWSVIRSYGVKELREKLRYHIKIAARLAEMISGETDFEILAPVVLSLVCFRYIPAGRSEKEINDINEKLNHKLNDSGQLYLTHTVLNGKYTLRMVTAQTNVTLEHVEKAWDLIRQYARGINSEER